MKIVVFSDSHRDISNMAEIIRQEQPDLVLHLGDLCEDIEEIQGMFPLLALQNVCGNCDGFTDTPEQRVLQVPGARILMMHGHRYGVKQTYRPAIAAARELHADILLFGHTHLPYCENLDGLWVLNPGSCQGHRGTYGRIFLENGKILCYTIPIK